MEDKETSIITRWVCCVFTQLHAAILQTHTNFRTTFIRLLDRHAI